MYPIRRDRIDRRGETDRSVACILNKEVWSMCVSAWLLLSFFWAFWIFAFAGWWCGGIC